MVESDKFEKIEISKPSDLWDWLDGNHGRDDSVWLITWKAQAKDKYVSRDDVLDALIAYGWIDGIRRKLDDKRTMQLISPRKQQNWAATYKERFARLEAEGRMRAPGLPKVEAAKKNGQWNAMPDVDALVVPEDLETALASGSEWFKNAAPSYRRNVLRWVASAKKPMTRSKRIAIVAEHAQAGKKVPQY